MKILVVGGTGFLGGAITKAAVAAGHRVAVLSRQAGEAIHAPDFTVLTGDRYQDLTALQGLHFDCVYDTCAYTPDGVSTLLDTLAPTVGRYVYISSISVYGDYSTLNLSEEASVAAATPEHLKFADQVALEDRASADAYGEAYGPLKRSGECVALDRLGERAIILRVGALIGAGDYTDRMTYWVRRIDEGGRIPLAGHPDRFVQVIDVQDVAEFACHCAEHNLSGLYNVTSSPITARHLFETIRNVSDSDAQFVWLEDERVLSSGLQPWSEVPLWLPVSNPPFRHFFEINVEKALSAGLHIRALSETVSGILDWDRTRRAVPLKCGMPLEKERALLAGEA